MVQTTLRSIGSLYHFQIKLNKKYLILFDFTQYAVIVNFHNGGGGETIGIFLLTEYNIFDKVIKEIKNVWEV